MPVNLKIKYGILFSISLSICIAIISYGPIPQDIAYHAFADKRTIAEVPNFWNVISNLPFLIVGLAGILYIFNKENAKDRSSLFMNNLMFFCGIFLTGIGSSYYHYFPSNNTLVWDRLPMTISFMAFFSIIIGRYICLKSAKTILVPLLSIGLMSVIYWQMTESKGNGDLRFYILVQFLPIVLIPMILLLFQDKQMPTLYIWLIMLAYGLAKIGEATDKAIFYELEVSGHTIKHFLSALAPVLYLMVLKQDRLRAVFKSVPY